MPNWCHNTLNVRGEQNLLAAFAEKVNHEHQPLTFEAHVPMPDWIVGQDWYAWSLEHWGTKWDASFNGPLFAVGDASRMDLDASVESQGLTGSPAAGMLVYKFDTAWSPPVPWLIATSEQESELEFVLRFGEVGNEVAGELKFVAGLCVEQTELKVEEVLAPEEMWF